MLAVRGRVLRLLAQERLGFGGDGGILGRACPAALRSELMMYFSNGTAMKVNALQKIPKFGLAGCHRNGTLASNSHAILRTTKSVIDRHLPIARARLYTLASSGVSNSSERHATGTAPV